MPDILPTNTALSASAVSPATKASGLSAVQVAITNVPSVLEDLNRIIQTNATVTATPSVAEVMLATVLGNVTVSFAQQLSVVEKQNLMQQLITLLQTQKPLTLTLQPGSPPTQGTLLLPATTPPASVMLATVPELSLPAPLPSYPSPPLAVGDVLPAIVLTSTQSSQPIPIPDVIDAAPFDVAATEAEISASGFLPTGIMPPDPQVDTSGFLQTAMTALSANTDNLLQTEVESPPNAFVLLQTTPLAQKVNAAAYAQAIQSAEPMPNLPSPPSNVTPVFQRNSSVAPQSAAMPASPANATISLQLAEAVPQTNIFPTDTAPAPAAVLLSVPTETTLEAFAQPQSAPQPVANVPSAPQPSAELAALLKPGNEVILRVDAVLPDVSQSGNAGQIPSVFNPNQIVAAVSGNGTDGQLILKTAAATLYVKAPVSAPIGASVILSVDQAKDAPLVTLPDLQVNHFQALPQALAALVQINPQALQQIMANTLPQPTQALPGALLFLFSAFKQGSVRDWLGDAATESLTFAGKEGIIAGLAKDLGSAGQPAHDSVVGQWQAYPIPLYAQEQFQSLTLYVHNDREARKDQAAGVNNAGRMRFLIDMKLTKLGAMQVDGFVQPKKLDMILRSETVLPEGLHHETRAAYIKALGAVGYAGTLSFQVGRRHWIVMKRAVGRGIVT
ncbi:MAG: hypothetical protein P4M13_08480 [Alphaproteobacteria bacterium]|nr:hypothetical protein [Alphaproteobacteria bacterium]